MSPQGIVPSRSVRDYEQLVCAVIARFEDGLPLPTNDMIEQDEQRVAMAVYRLLGISLEYWSRLTHAERKPHLEQLLTLLLRGKPEAETGMQPAKRTGRRKKTEKDSASLVVAALNKWHGNEGGSVTNHEHATNRGLGEKFGLSKNALSRFLKDQ